MTSKVGGATVCEQISLCVHGENIWLVLVDVLAEPVNQLG